MSKETNKPKKTEEQRRKERETAAAARKAKLDKMSDAERAAYVAAERADNFKKIGKRRLTNIVKAIRNLGKLSSNNYRYTEDQVNKIEETLNTEIESLVNRFRAVKPAKQEISVDL